MKLNKILLIMPLVSIFLGACSSISKHSHSRGTVVYKDSEKLGHVCIDQDEVKSGDIVKLYKNDCKLLTKNNDRDLRKTVTCTKQFVGEGKIVEISNEHFSKIEVLGNLNLEEGLIVEKTAN